MMEIGDIGIKGSDDIVRALHDVDRDECASILKSLSEVYKERFSGMLPYLVADLMVELRKRGWAGEGF